jgi:FHA domain
MVVNPAVPMRATAVPSRARHTRTRAATPTRAAIRIRAATADSHTAVRSTVSRITAATARPRREPGYGEPAAAGYDYGQPAGQGYGGGYADGAYPAGGTSVTLQLDDGSGRTYQLREGANVIGRGQDAQFRLPDTGVSRRHLEIRWDGQVALLSDLNSTNGTTVNNAPVQEWQLADGDVIRLGHSEIIVRVH